MHKRDAELQRDVLAELEWDPSVGCTEVAVATKDGVVTLAGEVSTVAQREAAVAAAERVSGVRAVADELVVKVPASTRHTDVEIAHAVAEALEWDSQVPDGAVKALIEKGWVTLDGEVRWQYQRGAAERAVRYLAGVTGVTNNIAIAPSAFVPSVRSRIEDALRRGVETDLDRIQVEAIEGKVTLRGSVHSWSARKEAEDAAWSAPGVTDVQNELVMKS